MIKSYKTLIYILLVSIGLNAFAGSQKLAYITNDEDKEIIDLILITNNKSDATQIKLNYISTYGKTYKTEVYDTQEAAKGVVLYQKQGRDIVKLKSLNFSSHQGGHINLNYLVNGITGKRANSKYNLEREGDRWFLKSNYKKVKKMHFVSNKKPLIGTIGIKTIYTY